MKLLFACLALIGAIFAIGAPGAAHAQAVRTWVSGVGDDATPCSRTAPCRTFNGAYGKTSDGGEINCLDPGSFGSVVITKSLTIDCKGGVGTLGTSSGGIIRVENLFATVVLRGLSINGYGGASGIVASSFAKLTIIDCRVTNTSGNAIYIGNASTARAAIIDTQVIDNLGGGIYLRGAGSNAILTVSMTNVQSENNTFGLRAEESLRVSIKNSSLINNQNNGLLAYAYSDPSIVWVTDSDISNNGVNGVAAAGSKANVRLSYTQVVGNQNGLNPTDGGRILTTTPASNSIYGNTNMNTPTGTLPLS